jgi:chorismate mutase
MAVRAIRGATMLQADDRDEMLEAVPELLRTIFSRNELDTDSLISIVLTATPDLHSEFPAVGARELGLGEVPLLCTQELAIDGALPRVVRVLIHADVDRPRAEIVHVYLRGTEVLRRDLAQ